MAHLPPAEPVTGESGELLTRLHQALTVDSFGKSVLAEACALLVVKLGIEGVDPRDVERFPAALRQRAELLLSLGLLESFVVISIRDEVSRWLNSISSFKKADMNRAEIRAGLQNLLDDDNALQAYRRALEETDPSRRSDSDEEIRAGIRKMMGRVEPVSSDEAARVWELENSWRSGCTAYLSDEDISAWEREHLRPKGI